MFTRPDDTVAVRVRILRTTPRLLLGVILLPFGAFGLLGGNVVLGLGALWAASVLLGKTEYLVSVENDLLVFRTISPFAPNLTKRIGMDRVRGREVTLLKYRRDQTHPGLRPTLRPRLALYGEGGVLIGTLGSGLTDRRPPALHFGEAHPPPLMR